MDIDAIRADTPLTAHAIYLDTAAAAPPPQPVLDCVCQYLQDTGRRGIYQPDFRHETYARIEAVRARLAGFLGTRAEEMAFTKNGSEAISLLARGLDWQPGDEVLVADTEMMSNLLPWQRLARQGVVLKRVAADAEGRLNPDAFAAAISPRTRLLTFSQLPNASGAIQPATAICQLARRHGVLSVVDICQSVGLLELNLASMGCDFAAGCGRKALRAIEGSGFLYVRQALLPQLEPALTGWWNGMVENGELQLCSDARRFEAGCPITPAILALGSAIEYAERLGMAAIAQRVSQLTRLAVEQLTTLPGFQLYGPRDSRQRIGIIPFNLQGQQPARLVEQLATAGCIIEAGSFMADSILTRHGISQMARLSLHYFNTEAEIEKTVQLLAMASQT
jgi:cysteine desulfurase/selenocysteine lyase